MAEDRQKGWEKSVGPRKLGSGLAQYVCADGVSVAVSYGPVTIGKYAKATVPSCAVLYGKWYQ